MFVATGLDWRSSGKVMGRARLDSAYVKTVLTPRAVVRESENNSCSVDCACVKT